MTVIATARRIHPLNLPRLCWAGYVAQIGLWRGRNGLREPTLKVRVAAGVVAVLFPVTMFSGAWWTNGRAVIWLRRVPTVPTLAVVACSIPALAGGVVAIHTSGLMPNVGPLFATFPVAGYTLFAGIDARLRANKFVYRIDTYGSELAAVAPGQGAGIALLAAATQIETAAGRTIGGHAANREVLEHVHIPAGRHLDDEHDDCLRTVAHPEPR